MKRNFYFKHINFREQHSQLNGLSRIFDKSNSIMLSLSNISYSIHVFLKPQIQSCLVFVLCTLIETAKVHHQASSSNRPGSVSEVISIQQASLSIGESTQGIDVESAVPEETAEFSPTLL